jgi:hypothetical protein
VKVLSLSSLICGRSEKQKGAVGLERRIPDVALTKLLHNYL